MCLMASFIFSFSPVLELILLKLSTSMFCGCLLIYPSSGSTTVEINGLAPFGTWVINVKAISKPLVRCTWHFIFV